MQILIIGNRDRYEKFIPDPDLLKQNHCIFCEQGTNNEELLRLAGEAEVIFADAIATINDELISHMPNLKLIHSEGVAYHGIDIKTARERSIYVCNNGGCNAGAVAEQAIYLMLSLLRKGIWGDRMVREGHQIEAKVSCMTEGIRELSECSVGFVGFGDIAKETALRLRPFGCKMYYNGKTRKPEEIEKEYQVTYVPCDSIAEICDIISIHAAVTEETKDMINEEFISKMKNSAYLINTARGEIVNNQALREALIQGRIAGAGLDTIYPEPTRKDNPLVDLPEECRDRVIYSPHLGGITTGSFRRAHTHMWENVSRLIKGERPDGIVNN